MVLHFVNYLHTEIPLEFSKPLSDVEVTEKETATFECEASKPKQSSTWHQAGGKIEPGVGDLSRFRAETDGKIHRLVIESAQMDDAEKYSCNIKDKKTSAKLIVKGNRRSLITTNIFKYTRCRPNGT